MKKIFASLCLLAFTFLAFNVTPAYSREIRTESISYSPVPGISYTTTKVTSSPKKVSTGAKIGTAIAATALIGGIVTLGVLAANDRPPHHDYYYDDYRGPHHSYHNPPKPMPHHNSHHNMNRAPITHHKH